METAMKTISLDSTWNILSEELEQAVEIYDVVASVYKILLSLKNDDDKLFLMRVCTLSEDWQYSKNAVFFTDFREKIIQLTNTIDSSPSELGIGIDGFKVEFISTIRGILCPTNMEKEDFIAFCMYYSLEAIDLYIKNTIEKKQNNISSFGPLNYSVNADTCLVYLQEQSSILKGAYGEKEFQFRTPLRNDRIGSVFDTILMMKRSSLCDSTGVPNIAPITVSEECKDEILKTKQFKIASIPFIGFDTFKIYDTNSQSVHDTSVHPKGPFHVKYNNDDSVNIDMVLSLLCKAINGGANIIVFPEFIMSPHMLKAVKDKLGEIEKSEKKQLIAVLAGTTCEFDEDHKGNNILHILNSCGFDIGQYYKYSQYVNLFEEKTHSVDVTHQKGNSYAVDRGENDSKIYFGNCEILSDLGQTCTLIEANPIGRILPAICRDVTDGKYTSRLVEMFMPTLLLVPAWSSSISSFKIRFRQYAESIHVSSLMCNCCNAIEDRKQEKTIGVFAYPIKSRGAMSTEMLDIKRPCACQSTCRAKGGCVRYVHIDFSTGKLKCHEEVTYPKTNELGIYLNEGD